MISKKKLLSLLLLGSLLGAQTAALAEKSFLEKVANAWKDNQKNPDPIHKKAYDMTKEQLLKIKKNLPKAVRMVLLSACAALIGKIIFKALVKKPLEVAGSAVSSVKSGLLKKMYISTAMSILEESKSVNNLLVKAIENAESLSTSELIALYGLYLTYKSGDVTAQDLSNDSTVNKMISDSQEIDKEKLVELVLKAKSEAKKRLEEERKKLEEKIKNMIEEQEKNEAKEEVKNESAKQQEEQANKAEKPAQAIQKEAPATVK